MAASWRCSHSVQVTSQAVYLFPCGLRATVNSMLSVSVP